MSASIREFRPTSRFNLCANAMSNSNKVSAGISNAGASGLAHDTNIVTIFNQVRNKEVSGPVYLLFLRIETINNQVGCNDLENLRAVRRFSTNNG